MLSRVALKAAIDLMHVPSQVRVLRSEPLPEGVPTLLRIAAGEEEAGEAAAAILDRSRDVVRRAAVFFIEQILFAPDADSYRVLGAAPQATASDLRRNVALLLRWLHPDTDPHDEQSIFIGRVTAAWNNLKTPERRAAYDAAYHAAAQRRGAVANLSRGEPGKRLPGRARTSSKILEPPSHRGGRGIAGARIYRYQKTSFIRRALAVLFQRPLA